MISTKRPLLLLLALAGTLTTARAEVVVDVDAFGTSLGGWMARKGKAAEYELSEAGYRTYQPEVSPSPDGGIFISVRIDHRRGFFASDDHASLELSFAPDGTLVSAQSSLALQGRTISSELIKGGASASTSVAAPQIDRAVKVGTDLVADLTSKLLREKIVEPGRVSFPAAIRHNYNLLYKAVKYKDPAAREPEPTTAAAQPPMANPAGTQSSPPGQAASTGETPPAKPEGEPKPQAPAAAGSPPPAQPQAPATPPPAESSKATAPAADQPAQSGNHLVPTRKSDTPAKDKAAPSESPAKPAPSAPQAGPGPGTTQTVDGKTIPLPDVKAYNPAGAPSTPLPANQTPAKEKSLLMEHGGEVLKLARDVVKTQAQ